MEELYQKINAELPNQPSPNKKTQIIIKCYWRWLVCGKIWSEATTTEENGIKKKTPKRGG